MGERTAIAWTDNTWNPWHGCTKVSPGCAHCYMYRDKARYGQNPELVVRSAPSTFNAPRKWTAPARVFTCSWSDFFHETADAWRADAWEIIQRTPHLTYQILTKRPERIKAHLPADWGSGYPNVWLGVSVENQHWVRRIHDLALIPAAVRFASCEPLLGPVDLHKREVDGSGFLGFRPIASLDWVICGGESGPAARPMHLDWARDLRDECFNSKVAFFLKQLGGWPNPQADALAVLDGRHHTEFPAPRVAP